MLQLQFLSVDQQFLVVKPIFILFWTTLVTMIQFILICRTSMVLQLRMSVNILEIAWVHNDKASTFSFFKIIKYFGAAVVCTFTGWVPHYKGSWQYRHSQLPRFISRDQQSALGGSYGQPLMGTTPPRVSKGTILKHPLFDFDNSSIYYRNSF